jgi:alpha-mannosidase
VAWLWPWAETERKIARTVINQLALIEEYPEYRYLQSQPHLYTMLKNRYPELYERFKQAVLAGKVIADGAMWVEADTNLSGGESLIRQILYGREFFNQEFSIDSRILWLPDVFGYSGALPQILRGCGCIGFATQKITWAYNGGEPFPYNTFLWEGIDGTAIPAHIFTDYNSQTNPSALLDRWESRLQFNGIRSILLSFGWGDGGGGPTRDHLEFLSRAKDLEGLPKVKMASPAEFFADLKQQGLPKERYVGELYFQAHRGTYTSQAKTKLGNRRGEFTLREAEFWGSIARTLNRYDFTHNNLKDAWYKLMLNQFHDILPGSSIHRVYEEAEAAFTQVISMATSTAQSAAATFTKDIDSVSIFNSLSWERTAIIEMPEGPVQVIIPPCGWTTISNKNPTFKFPATDEIGLSVTHEKGVKATQNSLENEFLCASFNSQGELISLLDKENDSEVITGAGNRLCLYKDVPSAWDAWDIDSMTVEQLVPTDGPVRMEVITSNPLISKIKIRRKLHNSILSQIISLRQGSRRIDFETTVDWQESHKLLKVAFPVNIHANEAIHEIQFGHIRRPNHRSRPYDADRFEVCNHKWSALAEENQGVAILNDCKYGISVTGNSLNLTLLKSPLAPDPTADKGVQTFTYALYIWNGSFAECNVVREAYELNCPLLVIPGSAGEASLFNLDAKNIILETVKLAEDGSEDIILRLYESKRMSTHCILSTTLPVYKVAQTDMIENDEERLLLTKGEIPLKFRPFEIKTLRLSMHE